MNIWEPLKSFFSGLWEGIGGVFDQVSGRIKAAFAPLQPMLGAVAAGFSWLCDQAGRLLSNLGSLFGSSQDTAQGLEEVRSVGVCVGEVIGKGLVAAFGLISAPARGVVATIGWVAENFGTAIDWVSGKAGEASVFLSDLWKPVATAAAAVWKEITDSIGTAIDWIAGKLQLVGEAMNGLSKVASKIGGWAGDAGSWLTFGAFDKEPSKVGDAMPIAANDNKPAMGAAMAAKPPASKNAVGSAVTASKPAAASFAAPSASAAEKPAKSKGNVVQFRPSPSAASAQATAAPTTVTVTINAAPGMDERAIAQQVKLALQDAMREADAKRRAANHD